MQLVLARSGRPVRLGAEVARGGEGAVHLLPEVKDHVAKIYLSTPAPEKIAKLQAMSAAGSDDLIRVSAWPTDTLTDAQSRVRGFIMPRIDGKGQAHELYTPKTRAHAFPEADLRFVLHVAANIVRAFGTVHGAGHVIGDVNHGHLFIWADGRVTLIDCDSFQIRTSARTFTCDVGVPLFTAPELHGKNFRGLLRTANHDLFGLAVMLFHLLYMGRHPYAGVPQNAQQSPEIEPAIRAGRFAYGRNRRALGIDQPPGTIPLETYGREIAELFERAFAHPPNPARPDATAWLATLTALAKSLKACAASRSHFFPGHLAACPWCAIEAKTGARLFGSTLSVDPVRGTTDVAALWRAIEAVPSPGGAALPAPRIALPARSPAQNRRRTTAVTRKAAAVAMGLLALVLAFTYGFFQLAPIGLLIAAWTAWPKASSAEKTAARAALQVVQRGYDGLVSEWKRSADGSAFESARNELRAARSKLEGLPAERRRRLAELTSERKQRELFLDGFRIDRASIRGVGRSRAATLASFGIETAWDVERYAILRVPGFGEGLCGNLIAWRGQLEARFRYDPNKAGDPAEVRRIDADIAADRAALLRRLQQGAGELRRLHAETLRARERLTPAVAAKTTELAVAKRDLADL